jgi:hypothetical protein
MIPKPSIWGLRIAWDKSVSITSDAVPQNLLMWQKEYIQRKKGILRTKSYDESKRTWWCCNERERMLVQDMKRKKKGERGKGKRTKSDRMSVK